ncbi:MAG: hypothetical protein JW874_08250 [Spirochaetales bacterium]|nr:hypothetical protein [Spirochaetales bacterium]
MSSLLNTYKFSRFSAAFMFMLLLLAACGHLGIDDDSTDEDNDEEVEIPLDGDTIRIWTVGDSITEGTDNGYRNMIWTMLTDAGNSVDFIGTLQHDWPIGTCPDPDHDGHPGWTIGDIAGEIDSFYAQIAGDDPQVLLIMLGTNDLAWWVSSQNFVDSTDERMMALVDHIFNLDGDLYIIVGTIPPMSSEEIGATGVDRALYADQYRDELIARVEDHELYGSRLFLVDMHSALTVADLGDGIHPTLAGYDKMGEVWVGGIAECMQTWQM